jgi:hypothetical protein
MGSVAGSELRSQVAIATPGEKSLKADLDQVKALASRSARNRRVQRLNRIQRT